MQPHFSSVMDQKHGFDYYGTSYYLNKGKCAFLHRLNYKHALPGPEVSSTRETSLFHVTIPGKGDTLVYTFCIPTSQTYHGPSDIVCEWLLSCLILFLGFEW